MTNNPALLYVVGIVGVIFIIYSLIQNWREHRKTLSQSGKGEQN